VSFEADNDLTLERISKVAGVKLSRETKIDDIGFDSLELLEFYTELSLERSAISDFETVGEIVDHITARAA
jgi:acyl carrier protein